jgi:hypothetical protein
VINGERDAVNRDETGTKAAVWYRLLLPARGEVSAGCG